jgi:acyl-CoA hydrolase
MEIGIRVTTEDLVRHLVRHTNSCYFTMVAVDDEGHPAEVPTWVPRTDIQRRRHAAAMRRRALRRELEQREAEGQEVAAGEPAS